MKFSLAAYGCVLILVAGCAATPQKQHSDESSSPNKVNKQKTSPPLVLERMDVQFLYLSAQQALHRGQPTLAVRFLKALVKKDPDAVVPRFELVDLLLAGGQRKKTEARSYMQAMPKEVRNALADDERLTYQQLYARSLIAAGDVQQAVIILEDLLREAPERVEVRLLLARLHVLSQAFVQAHTVVHDGLKLEKNMRLQQLQVQLFLQQGELKKADAALGIMQQDYPEHEDIVLQRAHLAEKQGNGIKAEMLLQQYIETHEGTAVQSYHMLAGVYVRQNRVNSAITVYEKLLPITASDAEVLIALGKLHYQQQEFVKARDYFKFATRQLTRQNKKDEMSENLAVATFYYGASLEASHQRKQAVPEYEKIVPKHNLYLDAQLRLTSIAMTLKEYTSAEQRLMTLLESYKHELDVFETLAGLRLQQKQYQRLITESEQALDLGFSEMLLFNRAVAFEKLKQFEQLDDALLQILDKKPNDAEALNFYGYSLAERGMRLNDAQEMVEKALTIKPNDAYYLDSLAWVFYKQQKYDKALDLQLKAVEAVPSDPVMMEHLGDIYWQQGNAAEAKVAWQKALDRKHEMPNVLQKKIEQGLM